MFRVLVMGVLLAGCYKPSFRDCAISCDDSTGCPSGLTCDMTAHMCALGARCGAGIDSGTGDAAIHDGAIHDARTIDANPNADDDNDGIKNGSDDCPEKANADQADEDTDGVGDVCDPCPISAVTIDSDGDGLPDPCDPHPTKIANNTTVVDAIIRFEPFNSALAADAITHGVGASVSGGHAFISAGGGHEGYLTYPVGPQSRGITVYTQVRYQNNPVSGEAAGVETEVRSYDVSSGRPIGYGCEVDPGTPDDLGFFETGNQSYDSNTAVSLMTLTSPLALSIGNDTAASTSLSCRLATPFSQITQASVTTAATYDAGIYAYGITTAFDYVMIVATTP